MKPENDGFSMINLVNYSNYYVTIIHSLLTLL